MEVMNRSKESPAKVRSILLQISVRLCKKLCKACYMKCLPVWARGDIVFELQAVEISHVYTPHLWKM